MFKIKYECLLLVALFLILFLIYNVFQNFISFVKHKSQQTHTHTNISILSLKQQSNTISLVLVHFYLLLV